MLEVEKKPSYYFFACISEYPPSDEEKSRWQIRRLDYKETGTLARTVELPGVFSFKEKNWLEWLAGRGRIVA